MRLLVLFALISSAFTAPIDNEAAEVIQPINAEIPKIPVEDLTRNKEPIEKQELPIADPELPNEKLEVPIENPELPIIDLELPIENPELPIKDPELPTVNAELPIDKPVLPVVNPDLPISSQLPVIDPERPIDQGTYEQPWHHHGHGHGHHHGHHSSHQKGENEEKDSTFSEVLDDFLAEMVEAMLAIFADPEDLEAPAVVEMQWHAPPPTPSRPLDIAVAGD